MGEESKMPRRGRPALDDLMRVTISIPATLHQELQAASTQLGITMAALMRSAMVARIEYLREHCGINTTPPTPMTTPPPVIPTIGRIVHYRSAEKSRYPAPRPAIITDTSVTADERRIEDGAIPTLDSTTHVHLWVFDAGPGTGGFSALNVPQGEPGDHAPDEIWYWPPR